MWTTGKWIVKVKPRSVVFRQVLNGPEGYAYVYEKTLTLDKNDPVMTLDHSLKNTGQKTIDTYVYDHDFFMFDGKPIGPGMVVHFTFEPKAEDPLGAAAKIEGKDLVYVDTLAPRKGVSGYLTGYSDRPRILTSPWRTRIRRWVCNRHRILALARLYFWSTLSTICPEGYIHLNVPPGKTSHWKIRYRFFAPAR